MDERYTKTQDTLSLLLAMYYREASGSVDRDWVKRTFELADAKWAINLVNVIYEACSNYEQSNDVRERNLSSGEGEWESLFEFPIRSPKPQEKPSELDIMTGMEYFGERFPQLLKIFHDFGVPNAFLLMRQSNKDLWQPFDSAKFDDAERKWEVAETSTVILNEGLPTDKAWIASSLVHCYFKAIAEVRMIRQYGPSLQRLTALAKSCDLMGRATALLFVGSNEEVIKPFRSGRRSAEASKGRVPKWERALFPLVKTWCEQDLRLTLNGLVERTIEFKMTPEGRRIGLPGADAIKAGIRRMERYSSEPLQIPRRGGVKA